LRQDRSTTTTKYLYVTASIFIEKVFHVFEKLYMPALVTGNSNALDIFFNGRFNNFPYTPVVAKVNDLGALTLKYATHNINGSIMSIEKRSCCYDTDPIVIGFIFWLIIHSKRMMQR